MYQHYALGHVREDWHLVLDILREKYPEMSNQSWESMRDRQAHFCNIAIMKRSFFDGYCEILFSIIKEMKLRKNFDVPLYQGDSSYNKRVFAFTAERILSIYLDSIRKHIDQKRIQECSVAYLK